jgi:RNA polymerase sigma-70 factor (ECF subfamily)
MESREDLWAEAMRAERRGDSAAYQGLLSNIADFLRKLVRYKLGQFGLNQHEAEDLVQEILIALHTKRHTWDQDRPFMPWLMAVTRYKLIDSVRRMRRETARRIDLTYEEMAETIAAPASDPDLAGDIERHLSDLPDGQQAVVRSIAIDGASVRETAQKLSASEGSVRVAFHRALHRLRILAKQKDQE